MMGQEHLRNIALLPGVEVASIFEPDAASHDASRRLAPQARMVTRIGDLLAEPSLDALVIVSPNHCHAEQIGMIAGAAPAADAGREAGLRLDRRGARARSAGGAGTRSDLGRHGVSLHAADRRD